MDSENYLPYETRAAYEEAVQNKLSEMELMSCEDLFVKQKEIDRADMPGMTSPKWTSWVLAQLQKDEKYDDKPTCEGLKRIATDLFGPMSTSTKVHAVNEGYAAVTCTLLWDTRHIQGSAEVHTNNTDPPFNQYPLATAETRAIGRALRSALNLKKIITAEEGSRKASLSIPITDENRTEGGITLTQTKFVDLVCKKNDFSVKYIVESAVGPHNKLEELTYAEALQVLSLLDEWMKNRPVDVVGYDINWKESF